MNRRGNLPAELTSLVGRTREVRDLRILLGRSRLVSLTGPGGVGKTRIAQRLGQSQCDAYPDGVWFVDLAAVRTQDVVEPTVATVLGVEDARGYPEGTRLGDKIAGWHALLILDNCEHLLDACAEIATHLLDHAPDLRVLVTGREPLEARGEHVLTLEPLPTPSAAVDVSPDEAAQYPAVRLLLDRAAAVAPGFAVDESNVDAVTTLVRELDGIPLAIELAAARLRSMSVRDLVERLDDRYRLLTLAPRGTVSRHQDLESLLGWSYDLCTSQERTLWRRLSVFAGPAELAAVEAACCGGEITSDTLVDLVDSLVQKSILGRTASGSDSYRMLTLVQEYGRRKLDASGETADVARRHAEYYRGMARSADEAWFGPDQAVWSGRLRHALPNFRAAMDFYLSDPATAETGTAMAANLWRLWVANGFMREGRQRMSQALALSMSDAVRAKAMWVHGWITLLDGRMDEAMSVLRDCVELSERVDEPHARDYATTLIGAAHGFRGEYETALGCHARALAGRRAADDPEGTATVLFLLAEVRWARHEFDEAIACAEECVAICADYQEVWAAAFGMWMHALSLYMRGELAAARELGLRSLRVKGTLRDTLGVLLAAEVVCWSAAAEGELEWAGRLEAAIQAMWAVTCSPLMGFESLLAERDRCNERVRRAMGEDAYRRLRGATANADLDTVLGLALSDPSGAPRQDEAGSGDLHLLTAREQQVARLVAEGLSNKQIASRLTVARRTVEAHVAHIMGKLDVENRVQVAKWYQDAVEGDPVGGSVGGSVSEVRSTGAGAP